MVRVVVGMSIERLYAIVNYLSDRNDLKILTLIIDRPATTDNRGSRPRVMKGPKMPSDAAY